MVHLAKKHDHATPLIPGCWREIALDGKPGDPPDTIKFACPNCGVEAYLDEHDVDDDGNVSPSVICPKECGFHDTVILKNFGEPDAPGRFEP